MMNLFMAIILIIIGTFFTSIGQILLKKSSLTITRNIVANFKNYILMGGIGAYFVSMLFTIYAFKGGELSILSPITALSYIWTVILSLFVFKETMNKYKWIGLIIIIIGVILIVQ